MYDNMQLTYDRMGHKYHVRVAVPNHCDEDAIRRYLQDCVDRMCRELQVREDPRARWNAQDFIRPFQREVNRAAAKIAEHQIVLGEDKVQMDAWAIKAFEEAEERVRKVRGRPRRAEENEEFRQHIYGKFDPIPYDWDKVKLRAKAAARPPHLILEHEDGSVTQHPFPVETHPDPGEKWDGFRFWPARDSGCYVIYERRVTKRENGEDRVEYWARKVLDSPGDPQAR